MAGQRIKNIIETQFTEKGAKNVAQKTDQIGKAQTRLGQSSASAGRSFSAQAQGLGGVVGVYAAAAANVFALTAAFTALNRAAQFETILRGTEQLANATGTNAESVVKSLKSITNGQLSIIDAATQANLALSAGFNIDQIEQLGSVALKASRALGRNLTDSFQRITRGAIKLEPELLDEIGIFTRIEPAVEAYAASLNKSAASLTRFEKRQAFVTQVIKDGEAAFADIINEGETTQEVFEGLVANFSDLAIQVGGVLANALVPFAKFLDQGLGNRLALLGAVGLLVFGRLKTAIGAFAVDGLGALSQRLSGVADSFANTTKNAEAFTKQASAASAAFVGGGALPGAGRAQGADIKRQLSAGGFTTQQALKLKKEIPDLIDNENRVQAALNENIKKGVINQADYNKQLEQSKIRANGLAKTQDLVKEQIKASSKAGLRFAGALNVAATAAGVLGTVLKGAFAVFQAVAIAITSLQLIGSLFDFDLIGELSEAYKNFTAESRRTQAGLEAIVSSAREGTPVFEELTRGIEGTTEELGEALVAGSKKASLSTRRLSNDAELLKRQIENLQDTGIRGFFAREFTFSFKSAEDRIKAIQEELNATNVALNPSLEKFLKLSLVVGTLAEESDVAAKSLGGAVANGLFELDERTNKLSISLEAGKLAIGEFDGSTLKLTPKIEKGAAVVADFAQKVKELEDKLAKGTISADKAGSAFGVIGNQAAKAATLLKEAGLPELADLVIDSFAKVSETVGKTVTEFVAIDELGKKISKTFSGAFKEVDEATLSGLVNITGEFARNSQEAARNQSMLLANLKTQADAQESLGFGDPEDLANATALFDLRTKIIKATEGGQLKLLATLDKQRISEEKKTTQMTNQLKILSQQNVIAEAGLKISEAKASESAREADASRILKNAEKALELQNLEVANNEKQLDLGKQLLTFEQKRQTLLAKQRDVERDLNNARENAALSIKKAQADRQVSISEMRGVNNPQEMSAIRIKAAEAATALELAAIEQRRQAAIDDYVNQTQAIDDRNALLVKEFEIENQKRQNAATALTQAQDVEEKKLNNTKAAVAAQLNILGLQSQQALAQKDAAILQANISKETKLADIEIQKGNAALIKERINNDKIILGENTKILNGYREVASIFSGIDLEPIKIDALNINTGNIDSVLSSLDKQAATTKSIYKEQLNAADIAFNNTQTGIDAQIEAQNIRKTGAQDDFDSTVKLNAIKLKGLQDEKSIAQTILDEKISLSNLEKDAVADTLILQMQKAGIDRQTAIAALEYAKQEERYKLSAQFRLDQALSNSLGIIEGSFTNAFTNLNEQLMNGTLTMDSVGNTFRDMLGGMMKAIQQEVFATTIAKPVGAGISKFIGNLFAGGGPVHMAGGGVMRRDRVHAMLEPGEFVMRKEAVKRIGMDQLQMMNSAIPGGKMEMIKGQPHMQAYITPGEASILKKLGGSGETYKGLPAFDAADAHGGPQGGPGTADASTGTGMNGGPGPNNPGFGQLGANVSSSAPGGSHAAASGSSGAVTAGQVQAAMDRARATGRTVGIVDALDSKSDREERAAQMSREQHDYAQEVAERAAAKGFKDRNTYAAKALIGIGLNMALANPFGVAGKVGVGALGLKGYDPGTVATGQKGLMGHIGDKIGGMIGGLFGGNPDDPSSDEEMASGGIVRMAGGGRVNQMRDRVPALLEPGEFVIRKPMAKAIGGKALGAMNATGSVSPGNVSVNINNQGSPKGATVSAPRMNGDKMIIDVITRDLRNNGSIRKSLRGGNY